MLGLVGLKGGLVESLLLLPLLFLWLFLWATAYDRFRRPLQDLSLQAASEMDRQRPPVSLLSPCLLQNRFHLIQKSCKI